MDTRPLGTTALRVSAIGLGLAALGRPGYINLGHGDDLPSTEVAAMRARSAEVLDEAWRRGVRYLDAARSYGRAEEFLAAWLAEREIAPAALTVGSKWGYTYTAGWRVDADTHEVKEHSLERLEAQWRESRSRLGDHLDLYQIHSATLDSGVLDNTPVLARLAQLKADGVAVGLSLSGPGQAATLERALDVEVDGRRLFDAVQATWNVLEPSAGQALARAREAGVGVIVKEALANGRLTERNREEDFAERREKLRRQAERLDVPLDALALAAVLDRPWCDVVLSGAATPDQLASNLRAPEVALDDEAREGLAGLAEPADAYWQRRAALTWT